LGESTQRFEKKEGHLDAMTPRRPPCPLQIVIFVLQPEVGLSEEE
jgi:hypothetical protein